ncbi:MAG TPA: hypothetical protein VFU46_13150 [Gemmatimonadales bacterium]|nr:hypothetical protein [Gemmatimonadales bacterium]
MRRHLLPLALLVAPGALAAQSSQFGVRGLGLPGREQSARAMGTAGAFASFDGESSVNPASIVFLGRLTATFTALGDYRSSTSPGGEASIRDPRFPQFLVGGPIRRFPLMLAASYSNYTTRDYSLAFSGTVVLRGQPVTVIDTLESKGGINDFRLAAAYRLGTRWIVGAGAHIITGSNRVEALRTFSDSTYLSSRQRAELSFAGFGLSVGVVGQLGDALTISALARSDGHVSVDRDTTRMGRVDLPITVGGAVRLRIAPKLHVAGQALYRNWSTANDDLVAAGGTGAVNTFEVAGGVEFARDPRRPLRLPVRLGFRYAQLPFPLAAGADAREYGVAAGSGLSFASDRAALSLAVERAWRDGGAGFEETAWILTAGVTVRP